MFKLALNAGHGYKTAGKRCLKSIDPNETREYVLNKRICDKIESLFSGYKEIEILRIDDGSELTITKRTTKANNFKVDLYLSIHHNAGINGGKGGGIEVYTYLKVSEKTKDWQEAFYKKIIEKTALKGNRAQPLRQANLGECRQTKMPAVLIECGYMDSVVDTPIILTEDFAEKAATACFETIVEKLGITKIKKTNEELAREVIRGDWGNGQERKDRLKKAGYDYSAVQKLVNKILKG